MWSWRGGGSTRILSTAWCTSINSTRADFILTHWGRVTHICVGELTIIVSDNGLSPRRRQAIIWTNAGILLIGPYGTNFSEILIAILTFSFTKMSLKGSSAKWRPFCLGLNVLNSSRHLATYTHDLPCPRAVGIYYLIHVTASVCILTWSSHWWIKAIGFVTSTK